MNNSFQERDALVAELARRITGRDSIGDQLIALKRLNALKLPDAPPHIPAEDPSVPPEPLVTQSPAIKPESLDDVRAQINATRDPAVRSKLASKAAALRSQIL
jgi:hypothetical protein